VDVTTVVVMNAAAQPRAPSAPARCGHGRLLTEFCATCHLACPDCLGAGTTLPDELGQRAAGCGDLVTCRECGGDGAVPCVLSCGRRASAWSEGEAVCGECLAAMYAATYCNDGLVEEPWTLADFDEANAEDPDLANLHAAVVALAVGETAHVDMLRVTRLS
ncbi:MAG TPA: hypothetical protein VIY73_24615, partial [Polyangiaceae bacterium]